MIVSGVVLLSVPDSPDECTSTPTYDQATGLLQSIMVTWDEVPVSFSDKDIQKLIAQFIVNGLKRKRLLTQ